MGFPVPPAPPVLMVALVRLYQAAWSGRLPDVEPGSPFWAAARDVPVLLQAGQAELAPPGTIAPPAEPPYTANGQAGVAAGTTNASH